MEVSNEHNLRSIWLQKLELKPAPTVGGCEVLSRLAHEVALTANGFSCSSRLSVALLPHSTTQDYSSDPIRRPPIGRIDRSQTKSRWSDYADRCGCGEWATGGNARPQSRVECNVRLLSAAGNCCGNPSAVHKNKDGSQLQSRNLRPSFFGHYSSSDQFRVPPMHLPQSVHWALTVPPSHSQG